MNNNGIFDDIDFSMNYQHQQQQQNQQKQNANLINDLKNTNFANLHHGNLSNLDNKNHKKSVPNIILTLSGDSIEEKNDILIKDLSNDINFNDILIKNESFDLPDLQMLSEAVSLDESVNHMNNMNTGISYN